MKLSARLQLGSALSGARLRNLRASRPGEQSGTRLRNLLALRLGKWLGALACGLVLVGCNTAGFQREYMALDENGDRKRDVFFTDTESIYCVAEVSSGVTDATVEAQLHLETWYSQPDGTPRNVNAFLAAEEAVPGVGVGTVLSFELKKSDSAPYLAGEYRCDLFLDGELMSSLPFEIRYPSCPIAPIFDGAQCGGYVLEGTKCPGALGPRCNCDGESWQCED